MQIIQNHSDLVTRKCFICEKQLYGACSDDGMFGEHEFKEPPSEAIVFSTVGNFGSTVLDGLEFEGKYIEITICDECYTKRTHLCVLKENERSHLPIFDPDELIKYLILQKSREDD